MGPEKGQRDFGKMCQKRRNGGKSAPQRRSKRQRALLMYQLREKPPYLPAPDSHGVGVAWIAYAEIVNDDRPRLAKHASHLRSEVVASRRIQDGGKNGMCSHEIHRIGFERKRTAFR